MNGVAQPQAAAHYEPQAPLKGLTFALPKMAAEAALRYPESFVFAPTDGPTWIGLGEAKVVQRRGESRFEVAEDMQRALRRVTVQGIGVEPLKPRWFGGFAFADTIRPTSPWHALGALRFVLPRWTFEFTEKGGRALLLDEAPDAIEARAELEELLQALEPRASEQPPVEVNPGNVEAYSRSVAELSAAAEEGRLEKAVLTREIIARASGDLQADLLFAALDPEPSEAVRFGVRLNDLTFLGVSPERLVERRGPVVMAHALAGSAPVGRDEEALLDSDKDRREHDFVVHHVEERLAPHCESIEVPAEPRLKRLTHVVHLHTPVTGQLKAPRSALELAADLHPTPAVGGRPLAVAREALARLEPHERGWYAGAVGWMDGDGDGAFWVALRSALLVGPEARIYAGGGIVRGSQPQAELRETEVKAQSILRALGVHA